jgi:hypothetical protein
MVRKRTKHRLRSDSFWDSFVFKYGSKLLLGLVVVVIFLTLVQCTIKKPESPVWNTKFTIPAVNRTYGMEELIRKMDQEGIGIDSSGMVTYSITKDLDTIQLEEDLLSTADLSYTASENVGTVRIGPPSVDPVSISLASISGLASSLPGDSAGVDSLSFNLYNDMPTITTFSSADVANGEFAVVVDNNLGISLDTVIVQIYDVVNAAVVATDTFPQPIASGSTASLSIALSGQSISNSFRVDEHCYTTGGVVDSASTRYVGTDVVFADSLEVFSAVAEIPALTRDFSEQVDLAETNRIDTAGLSGGSLNLSIVNATELNADLTITIPDIVSQGGQALTVDQAVPPRQNTIVNVDLSGYRLVPRDVTVPQNIDINVTASTPGTAPQQVQVNQSDSFFVSADLTSLTFDYVNGVFDSVSANFAGTEHEIDVPTGFDSLELVSAIITLEIENGVNLPGHLDLLLNGDNGKQLNFSGDIAAGGRDSATWSSLSNNSVTDFLSPIPSRITASGTAVFGDEVYQGTVYGDDYVFGRVKIHAPLEVIINESHIETDIESKKIDQDDMDIITDHVLEGRFVYNIINHLPLGARINFFFSGDSATLYANPELRIDSVFITAAPVSLDGLVSDTASTGYQEIYLDSADIKVLNNDTLYIGQEIILESSNGQTVKLTQDDYLTVIGRIEVNYRFDGEF